MSCHNTAAGDKIAEADDRYQAPPIIRLLRSPLAFLLFLIIPLAVVLLRSAGRNEHTLDLLLVNNALLLFHVAARHYLLAKSWSCPVRYETQEGLDREFRTGDAAQIDQRQGARHGQEMG